MVDFVAFWHSCERQNNFILFTPKHTTPPARERGRSYTYIICVNCCSAGRTDLHLRHHRRGGHTSPSLCGWFCFVGCQTETGVWLSLPFGFLAFDPFFQHDFSSSPGIARAFQSDAEYGVSTRTTSREPIPKYHTEDRSRREPHRCGLILSLALHNLT